MQPKKQQQGKWISPSLYFEIQYPIETEDNELITFIEINSMQEWANCLSNLIKMISDISYNFNDRESVVDFFNNKFLLTVLLSQGIFPKENLSIIDAISFCDRLHDKLRRNINGKLELYIGKCLSEMLNIVLASKSDSILQSIINLKYYRDEIIKECENG